MDLLIKSNDTIREKAQLVNASIHKGKKPSLTEISSIVRKVRKENASRKA